jgi:hypothetical protein
MIDDEQEAKVETVWFEPSPVGGEYMRHERAIALCASLPLYKAFAIAPGFNVGMLRRMVEGYKGKRFAVVDHAEAGIEIRRLDDNANVKVFYDSLEVGKVEQMTATEEELQVSTLLKLIREFMEKPDVEIARYDARAVKARNNKCVTHAYAQRRLSSVSVFRHDSKGAAEALNVAFSVLESKGILTKMKSNETHKELESSAKAYRIIG